MIAELRHELRAMADPAKAAILQRFFKTGKGQYGEGDVFLGLTVPAQRDLARRFAAMPLEEVRALLTSTVHEERSIALMLLVRRFQKGDAAERGRVCRFYLDHLQFVNNWDLVDGSAPYILGAWLDGDGTILRKLARSPRLWDRRVAMLATFHDIRQGRPAGALRIAAMLVKDRHDLIHKAVGWMLREVGKRCGTALEERFLERHAATMPRTMLRYAIERFPEEKRRRYLQITSTS